MREAAGAGAGQGTNEIKLAQEFGLIKGGQQLAGLLILITDVHALGLRAAQGLLVPTANPKRLTGRRESADTRSR